MRYLKPFWSFLFSHGLIILATAVIFLIRQEDVVDDQIFVLALLLFAAAVVQSAILWKKHSEGLAWFPPLLVILTDVVVGILILYAPEESLRIYVWILTGWSALMAILLLAQFSIKHKLRAAIVVAGIAFLILSIYTGLQLKDLENLDTQLLGILSLVFSIFLIFVALQLRFYKLPLPLDELQDNRVAHPK